MTLGFRSESVARAAERKYRLWVGEYAQKRGEWVSLERDVLGRMIRRLRPIQIFSLEEFLSVAPSIKDQIDEAFMERGLRRCSPCSEH